MLRMSHRLLPLMASASIAASTLVAGTMTSLPANAAPVPPNPAQCGASYSTSVPAAGKLKISIRVRCQQKVAEIYHGVTIQRPGWVTTGVRNCWNTTSCTFSKTVTNPRGSQRWEVHDEWNNRNVPGGGWLGKHDYWFRFSK